MTFINRATTITSLEEKMRREGLKPEEEETLKRLRKEEAEAQAKANTDAKLAQTINPNGNKDAQRGLSLQKAQDAAKTYCEYYASKGKPEAQNIAECTDRITTNIINCEEVSKADPEIPPEKVESFCIDRGAKINKPTPEMQKTAAKYCEEKAEFEGTAKAPTAFTDNLLCKDDTAQNLADCQELQTSMSKSEDRAARLCTKQYAKVIRPTEKQQKAAEEFCKETDSNNPGCVKYEIRSLEACKDFDVEEHGTSQEIAIDRCSDSMNEETERIKQEKEEQKQRMREQRIHEESRQNDNSQKRIRKLRLIDPSYEEA